MQYKLENGVLTIALNGRVDTSNATQVENEINGIIAANPYEDLVLDADNLEYISSAGLRVVLRLRKANATMKIINASNEVYEIFDMTGFTEMLEIEKAFRRMSVDGCRVIGKGAKGTVYRYNDDTIIKVYHNPDSLPEIKRERELARKAFVLGIPTAISYDVVRVDGSYGSVFELLDAYSFSQLIADHPENLDYYVKEYAELLKKIHATQVKADDMPDMKESLVWKWVKTAEPFLPAETAEKLKKLIAAVPDTLNMLHCDYHTNNVMMQNGETLLIDMDTLAHGHPIFELGNVYITYVGFGEGAPGDIEAFIGLSEPVANEIWAKFLPIYLGTDDPERLKEVEDKARVLSYTRRLRHMIRRGADKTEEGKKLIALCVNNLSELVKNIDTLEF